MSALRRLAPLLGLAAVVAAFAVAELGLASRLTEEELARGGKGYVTDEVWYVNAARNILVDVFGLVPKQPWEGAVGATVFYESAPDYEALEAEAERLGLRVNATYTKARAVYVIGGSLTAIESFASATGGVKVVPGWMYGDAEGIGEFLNTEHPPLVKYLIAAVMALAGDYPTYWRLPSVAFGSLLLVMTYLVARRLVDPYLALGAVALASVDPLVKSMSAVAMLDVYVAALTMVSLHEALAGRHARAVLWLALASTAKMSALTAALPLLVMYLQDCVTRGRRGFVELAQRAALYVLVLASCVFAAQLAVSAPLVAHMGFASWLNQSVFGAIGWHLSVKCAGEGCPPASAPWEWFLGVNPFALYYFSDGTGLEARGLVPFYTLALSLMIVLAPLSLYNAPFNRAWIMLVGTFAGYVLVWALGGRTQYSFYAVQLAPLVYTFLGAAFQASLSRLELQRALLAWAHLGRSVWRVLLRLLEPGGER